MGRREADAPKDPVPFPFLPMAESFAATLASLAPEKGSDPEPPWFGLRREAGLVAHARQGFVLLKTNLTCTASHCLL